MPRYLVWFSQHNSYFNCRFRELEALAALHGISRDELYSGEVLDARSDVCGVYVNLPNDEVAAAIVSRSVLFRTILDVWGRGQTHEEALADAHARTSPEERRRWLNPETPWCFYVTSHGKKIPQSQKVGLMKEYASLFRGDEKTDPKNAETLIWIVEEFSHIEKLEKPRQVFVARQVAHQKRLFHERYALSERPVLGPTTLDNDLSFLMSNWAGVQPGKIVMDPFVGTGGLLLAASHFGARVVGGDIDVRVIKGWKVAYIKNSEAALATQDGGDGSGQGQLSTQSIYTNFKAYGFMKPEVLIMDNAARQWRSRHETRPFVDCIVTDPPYGIRAGAKKIGVAHEHEPVRDRESYIPQQLQYSGDRVMDDLLTTSAEMLVDGGSLVYLLPMELPDLVPELKPESQHREFPQGMRKSDRRPAKLSERLAGGEMARNEEFLSEEVHLKIIPQHPDLEFVASSLQILSGGLGRLVVKMRRKPRSEGRGTSEP